jgi:hypothetical protein
MIRAFLAICSGFVLVACGGWLPFLIFELSPPSTPVKVLDGGNIVRVGSGPDAIALLEPDKDVLGNFYGQEIAAVIASVKLFTAHSTPAQQSQETRLADCNDPPPTPNPGE